ncbi:heat shock factor protein 1 isoform X3 [Latimeria chalumnae]|uniref:heat shock factor protein 1 isoform X3 n=1 Tax=Latimeria chalumnae TaxID=7897 RepID=UPI0006D8D87B|nr:PREDICTED: heat shock factor protein 1 isoform X3 [Latimeria chalumnae]|eukprot:XP_014344338.1 PREDICTED: heat shock factor protein 1 isoform X3 [Latimeria chalumnae]
MDLHGGGNVPAFLTKLWTLVEDPDTDPLICWSPSGNSFHVFDQGQFAKEVLPKYFKHNNMASFVRQLNMYGFRKVVHIEQGGLVKPEKDDTEFQHPYFIRGQEHLLENIKRKVTSQVSGLKSDDIKIRQDNMSKLLTDVQLMRGKQENIDSKLLAMKHENEALWREVASLRQKHSQQQKVVNKLIQFLISLVQSNRIIGVKRKIPLMLNDSSSAHSMPKYSRQYSLEHLHGPATFTASSPPYTGTKLYSSDSAENLGPIISDVTDLAQSSPCVSPSASTREESSPVIRIKEEPPSPAHSPQIEEVSVIDTGTESCLSPSTFIDSILQENETSGSSNASTSIDPSTAQSQPEERCLSVACLDSLVQSPQMSEVARLFPSPSTSSLHCRPQQGNDLCDHLDTIDSNLDNLQTMLSAQSFSMDTSTLFDLFNPSLPTSDMGLPDLDTSLDTIQDLLSSQEQKPTDTDSNTADTGKQLVHYSAQPLFLLDSGSGDMGSGDLPILFELGDAPYFAEGDESEDPTIALLSSTDESKPKDPAIS